MPLPELPDDVVVRVYATLSLLDLYWCRQVCSAWRQCAAHAKELKRALVFSSSVGGRLSDEPSVHPLVRGAEIFRGPGQVCGFGNGFLCVPEAGLREAVRIVKINSDGGLAVYDDVWPWMNPPFSQPVAALHACSAEGFEVLYVITNGEVRRFFVAEFDSTRPSVPTDRSAAAIATPVEQWFSGTFGELFYGYARRPDVDMPSFFKCSPGLDPPGAGPNQSSCLESPRSLALDADANELYVADVIDGSIYKVAVLDAKTLRHKRSFVVHAFGRAMVPWCSLVLLILGEELFISTNFFVHVYTKSGSFLRAFADVDHGRGCTRLCLSPEASDQELRPRGLAVYPIQGVDHMLVTSEKHVHVLTLPDGLIRQVIEIPRAIGLRQLCVHHGRVYVSDFVGNRIHILEGVSPI